MNSSKYNCKYCNRSYKLKNNYDKHYLLCDSLDKSKYKNNEVALPSLRDMFTLILELTAKNSKLEERVEELSKWVESKKKKLNLIDWLNDKYTKNIKYTEWLSSINIKRSDLEIIFDSDIVAGYIEIIKKLLMLHTNDENSPIKAYDQKENILFIYNDDNKWECLSPIMFIKLINIIFKNILREFMEWQKENKNKIYQDSFSYTYARNVQKIMGGKLSQEQLHSSVKKELYKYLKLNLKHVIDYEFIL
jgi:uncharacterized protein YeeX (DUF496 family)